MIPRTAALVPCLVLAACSAAPKAALAPLESLRHAEAELVVQPTERGLERARWDPWDEEQIAASRGLVTVRVRTLELDEDAAAELFAERAATLVSVIVPRAEAERLAATASDPSLSLRESTLTLHEEQAGYIAVTGQRAFVESFRVRSNGNVAAADPHIDVVTEGVQIEAVGRSEGDRSRVALEIRMQDCRFDREFAERDLSMGTARVTLQEPRGLTRTLTTHVTLAPDEVLIVGGASLTGRAPERALFALIEAHAVASEDAE